MDDEINSKLPFILKRENVARFEDGDILIGDRSRYPFEKVFVRCRSVEDVALAIETMVTQGGGPWVAACYALVHAVRANAHLSDIEFNLRVTEARDRLIATRPTHTFLSRVLYRAMDEVSRARSAGLDAEVKLLAWIEDEIDRMEATSLAIGRYTASVIDDGDGVLTMCFAEEGLLLGLLFAQEAGKDVRAYTPETRPYLQGARLTAPSIHEMGIPVRLITDGMAAHVMAQGKVQKYITAADLTTMDGHVVNKIGTFQNALSAAYHHIPYYAMSWGPDPNKENRASIEIEERDPAEIRQVRGTPTTIDEIDAYYPAFDITPPELVTAIITEKGILDPQDIHKNFGNKARKKEGI
jgi:methylthioribose-1-phosphate isomerase